jgi:two-component system response regulator CssR
MQGNMTGIKDDFGVMVMAKKTCKNSQNRPKDTMQHMNGYNISKKQRAVYQDGIEIQLTSKEFEVLNYFAENKNNLLSRKQILNRVWGKDYFGSDRVVDDTIRRLRKKVSKLNIETIYGYGYKLV